jgi:precorrin-2 dehydrogenase/sirohydrochlorin ferrochelatase
MIPIYLDPKKVRVAVIGRGSLALRRYRWLQEAGARADVWSDAPSDDLRATAEVKDGLPDRAALSLYRAIWIVDLPDLEAEHVAAAANEAGVLFNVEDHVALSNFHTPAIVRRGRLLLAAATGGASPAVARVAREKLEEAFPQAWGEALEEIAAARTELRRGHAGFDALVADARARLRRYGLISRATQNRTV